MDAPIKLMEGDTAEFEIIGLRTLPDDQICYLLRGPDGFSSLLPQKYFKQYGFETGKSIVCTVDRINCNGRIFLEPQHPIYSAGQYYPFKIINRRSFNSSMGVHTFLALFDDFNHIHVVCVDGIYDKDEIEYKVQSIHKGRLYLESSPFNYSDTPDFVSDKLIVFEKTGVMHVDNYSVFHLFINDRGGYTSLSFKYFHENRFFEGEKVPMLMRFSNRSKQIHYEPILPHFLPDRIYPFRFVEIIEDHDILRGHKRFIRVKDEFSTLYDVPAMGLNTKKLNQGQQVCCRIRSYRNGIPVPEIDQALLSSQC